jgi:hypothetical protein
MLRALGVGLLPAVLLGLGARAAAGAEDEDEPTASLGGVVEAEPGAVLAVTGQRWPGGTNVQVELCGNLGTASVDCDAPRSRTVGVGPDGMVSVAITVGVPPSPCPCVVRVSDLATSDRVHLPITVTGAAVAEVTEPLPDPRAHDVAVRAVEVDPEGRAREWFGLPARRTVRFEVVNTGTTELREVPVELLVGRSSDPTRAVAVPPVATLAPGASTEVVVDLELDPFAMGTYRIRGTVGDVGWVSTFETESSTFPWGLLGLALLAAHAALLVVRRAVRRRLAPHPAVVVLPERAVLPAPVPARLTVGRVARGQSATRAPAPRRELVAAGEVATSADVDPDLTVVDDTDLDPAVVDGADLAAPHPDGRGGADRCGPNPGGPNDDGPDPDGAGLDSAGPDCAGHVGDGRGGDVLDLVALEADAADDPAAGARADEPEEAMALTAAQPHDGRDPDAGAAGGGVLIDLRAHAAKHPRGPESGDGPDDPHGLVGDVVDLRAGGSTPSRTDGADARAEHDGPIGGDRASAGAVPADPPVPADVALASVLHAVSAAVDAVRRTVTAPVGTTVVAVVAVAPRPHSGEAVDPVDADAVPDASVRRGDGGATWSTAARLARWEVDGTRRGWLAAQGEAVDRMAAAVRDDDGRGLAAATLAMVETGRAEADRMAITAHAERRDDERARAVTRATVDLVGRLVAAELVRVGPLLGGGSRGTSQVVVAVTTPTRAGSATALVTAVDEPADDGSPASRTVRTTTVAPATSPGRPSAG